MGAFDFDTSHLDGIEEETRTLYEELEAEADTEIQLRAGYDGHPRLHDLQEILTPKSPRFQETESEMVSDLYEFVDNYFGETQYVDWTLGGHFEELQLRDEEVFEYSNGSELVVEVYEPGDEGHDILRL
ncbi:hypothetical protein EXE49_17070 [Halorubrum sp. ASP121]|uniref:hypothetical protein n=1 Tax=Halorubrum sp. ASP121 TaxID=1855858 RepID=UPI0010F9376E|nr:hypothetical protein [Halorubrum sp. ASP121]TKX47619.1 hypothetical protein EXE49_17070 [Halorubrum sp. ASP121]